LEAASAAAARICARRRGVTLGGAKSQTDSNPQFAASGSTVDTATSR
jgi:hypothetical protein